jgi:ribosome biogenesis GTPase A
MTKINHFPGHMKKALEELRVNIKKCDIVIYVLDARCPESCKNPEFDRILGQKPVIFYYSKRDLAPNSVQNVRVIDEIKRRFPNKVGFVKAMVLGVPNVGKSTLINKLCKCKKTKVENRPGVTRQSNWYNVEDNIYLLDTPGVLWPNLSDPKVAQDLVDIDAIPPHLFKVKNEHA